MTLTSRIAAGLLATALLAAPAAAATKVKVALLDMSAVAGVNMPGFSQGQGQGYGYGMMGRGGMMGWGGGWGPGGGRGMMGMGMMSIRADATKVKAGEVNFEVTNWSRGIVHEMLVVAVDSPDAPLPYNYDKEIVPEEQIKALGEIGELAPNTSGELSLDLPAGDYLLICNVPGHYAAGMVLPFTVTP